MSNPNSAKTQSKCASAFQLTLNEIEMYEALLSYLKTLNPNYYISCKEVAPSTGHEHIHIYVQFPRSKRLSLKKLLGAHIEACRASPQENIEYIKKTKQPEKRGEIIEEFGEVKKKGGKSIKDVENMSPEERKDLPVQLYNIVQKIEEKEGNDLLPSECFKEVEVFWYWGESGVGKTRSVMKEIGNQKFNMLKYENGFWHGIGNADVALYDDFRDTHMKPTELINFIDYYIHPMNVKGGSVKNKYKKIYITSIQDPEKIYSNMPEEYKKQWIRRIKKIFQLALDQI